MPEITDAEDETSLQFLKTCITFWLRHKSWKVPWCAETVNTYIISRTRFLTFVTTTFGLMTRLILYRVKDYGWYIYINVWDVFVGFTRKTYSRVRRNEGKLIIGIRFIYWFNEFIVMYYYFFKNTLLFENYVSRVKYERKYYNLVNCKFWQFHWVIK